MPAADVSVAPQTAVERRRQADGETTALAAVWPSLPEFVAPYRRFAVPIGAAALALLALYNMRHGASRFSSTDFQSFYGAAHALRTGADPYAGALSFIHQYSPTGNGTLFATKAFVYAPIFAIVMMPLSFLSPYQALTVWDLLNIGFVVTAVYALLRAAGVRPRLGTVLILAAAAAVTQPVHKEWQLGQTDVFILCVLSLGIWARQEQRRVLAGALLGFVCAIKPEFALLVLFLLWKREFRFALVAVVTALTLFLAPYAVLGGKLLAEQLTIWNFWSGDFIPFVHNISPKAVLARLFTINPVVRPLINAPGAVTALWLIIAAIVGVLTVALVRPAPLRRDLRSMLEIGLAVEAILLVTPLTEWPYLLMLVIPLLSVYAWLRVSDPKNRFVRRAAIALVVIWVMLCGPAQLVEYSIDPSFSTHSIVADLYVVLAPWYLYTLIAAFVLQLAVTARAQGLSIRRAVVDTVHEAPHLLRAWVADAGSSLPRWPSRQRQSA